MPRRTFTFWSSRRYMGEERSREDLQQELEQARRRIAELATSASGLRRAKEALEREKQRDRHYLDIAASIILALDADGSVTFLNEDGARILECTPAEAIGKSWFDTFLPERLREEVLVVFRRLMAGDLLPVEHFENAVLTGTGRERIIRWHNSILRDEHGRIAGTITSGEDITEHKRADEALRESEARYRALFNSPLDLIYIHDFEGRFLDANQSTLSRFGYTREEIGNLGFHDLAEEADLTRAFESARQIYLHGRDDAIHTYRLRTRDGEHVWVETTGVRIDRAGEPQAILGIARDVTCRKQAEEEGERLRARLQQVQKLESLGLLAGGIAHDFNNALAAIVSNVALARLNLGAGDPEASEALVEAEKAVLRASGLSQQLLTFAKGGAPVRESTSIANLLRETVRFALSGSNTTCQLHIPEETWPVKIDEGQINQVVSNIVVNADQALPNGGTISVFAENFHVRPEDALPLSTGRYVKVSVVDDGVGMEEAHLGRIFDPYFTTKESGSGLGLATSYSIVCRHGGHLAVTSKKGEGTAAHVYLPVSDKPPALKSPSREELAGSGERVLLMDDEESLREVIGGVLRRSGYDVVCVPDGAQAVSRYEKAIAESKPFSLVIVDLTVPGGMGGREAVARLREIDPGVRAIVSSGYSEDRVFSEYEQHGFCGAVRKPFELKVLLEAVHQALH
ncbi:PAS domain S-box protein [Planctomycetota bacterium]